MIDREYVCANCLAPTGPRKNSGTRGPDIAWFIHCGQCAELVRDQMELVDSQPTGAKIDIYHCTWCGTPRSCRAGWRTRCMVCLDERSVVDGFEGDPSTETDLVDVAALIFELPAQQVDWWHIAQIDNYLILQELLDGRQSAGWTVLATDVHGLPFGRTGQGLSHGTWARHLPCGKVQPLKTGRTECQWCPPEADSRTYRARAEDSHLLYLVRHGDLLGCVNSTWPH